MMKPRDYLILLSKFIVLLLLLIFLVKVTQYILIDIVKMPIPEKIFAYLQMLTIVPPYSIVLSEHRKLKKQYEEEQQL